MNSEEDTFDRLRRCDYVTACVEYTMACLHLDISAPAEDRTRVANIALNPLGWTFSDLVTESRKREQDEPN